MLHAHDLPSPAVRLRHLPDAATSQPPARATARTYARLRAADYDDGLLATAGPIMAGAYASALAITAFTFVSQGEALFAVTISSVFGAVYFAVAFLILYVRSHRDSRWRADGREKYAHEVGIYTGTIGRTEALLQMTIVPLAVVAAFSGFALIWIIARPFP